jgi:hypothetical protein
MVVAMANVSKIETSEASRSEREVAESVEWNAENEVKFFYALRNRRPVGEFILMVVLHSKCNID